MKTSCPLPKFDFDVITLGHGGGGLLTHRLLQNGVFDILGNDLLDQQHDGASFPLSGNVAFSTDSYVISPFIFPGGNIGELAVNGTVNDLAMCGAIPKYLSLSFIIEEGLSMSDFFQVLLSIKQAAHKALLCAVGEFRSASERGQCDAAKAIWRQMLGKRGGELLLHFVARDDGAQVVDLGTKLGVAHGVVVVGVEGD